jgi:hypothetical protein
MKKLLLPLGLSVAVATCLAQPFSPPNPIITNQFPIPPDAWVCGLSEFDSPLGPCNQSSQTNLPCVSFGQMGLGTCHQFTNATLRFANFEYYVSICLPQFAPTRVEFHGPVSAGGTNGALYNLDGGSVVSLDGRVIYTSLHYLPQPEIILTDSQMWDLIGGKWSLHVFSPVLPGGELCGPIIPPDSDNDGVSDFFDSCPNTPSGPVVNAHGCSIVDLCPCSGPWKNHGEYVFGVAKAAAAFREQGLITAGAQQAIVRDAARSDCGKSH